MKLNRAFLLAALIVAPTTVFGADSVNSLVETILKSTKISEANTNLTNAKDSLDAFEAYKETNKVSDETKKSADKKITKATENIGKGLQDVNPDDTRDADKKAADLKEKQDAYDDAKAKEQSTANKTLTAMTTAATGLGAMELAMGMSEQKADKNAEADMKAYLETLRCTYAEGKSVKAGPEKIELPGGNDEKLMSLRNEYFALAKDLKERKEALGMKPGIESEEILDKTDMGLYDDENLGKTGGHYESLYRAMMLGSEEDQAKIQEEKDKSAKRVKAGAIALGVGAGVGIIGNSLINGKLGEYIKNARKNTKEGEATKAAVKIEETALKELQDCLSKGGVNNTEKLTLDVLPVPSVISVKNKNLNCKKDLEKIKNVKGKDAVDLFANFDAENVDDFLENLIEKFGGKTAGLLIGVTIKEEEISKGDDNWKRAKTTLENSIKAVQKRFEDAAEKDKQENKADISGALSTIAAGIKK